MEEQGRGEPENQAFLRRVEACPPWDALDERDAYERYRRVVAGGLSSERFEDCARAALERLTPSEREHFAMHLVEQARHQDHAYTELTGKGLARVLEPADKLARVAAELFRRDPSIFDKMFTGAIHGRAADIHTQLASDVALAVFGGMAAEALRHEA